jgi:hypothetical protein
MSLVTVRGGIPHVLRATIDDTGQKHRLPFMCNWLAVRVPTGDPCRIYFFEKDFDADENYVIAPAQAAETPYGEWSGPAEVYEVWLKCDVAATSTIELVAYQRRG